MTNNIWFYIAFLCPLITHTVLFIVIFIWPYLPTYITCVCLEHRSTSTKLLVLQKTIKIQLFCLTEYIDQVRQCICKWSFEFGLRTKKMLSSVNCSEWCEPHMGSYWSQMWFKVHPSPSPVGAAVILSLPLCFCESQGRKMCVLHSHSSQPICQPRGEEKK